MANDSTARDYEVGRGRPPKEHRFQPNRSGNPSGRPRKPPAPSLVEEIRGTLNKCLRRRPGQRGSMTPKRLGIRKLVTDSAAGDLTALKNLLQVKKKAGAPQLAKIVKVSWAKKAQAKQGEGWRDLTEDFYKKQDQARAERRKAKKNDDIPTADIIEQELARRTLITPLDGSKSKRASFQTAIAHQVAYQHAVGNADMIKLLQDVIPETRNFGRKVYEEVARPNAEEQKWVEEQKRKRFFKFSTRDYYAEKYPNRKFTEEDLNRFDETDAEEEAKFGGNT